MHTHSRDCLCVNELNELGCSVRTDDTQYLAACMTHVVSWRNVVLSRVFCPTEQEALDLARIDNPAFRDAELRVTWRDVDNSREQHARLGYIVDIPTPPDVFPEAF